MIKRVIIVSSAAYIRVEKNQLLLETSEGVFWKDSVANRGGTATSYNVLRGDIPHISGG